MKIEIRKNRMGYNGGCDNCRKIQDGSNDQPFIVYYKEDNEKRGHNLLACSKECAEELKKKLENA